MILDVKLKANPSIFLCETGKDIMFQTLVVNTHFNRTLDFDRRWLHEPINFLVKVFNDLFVPTDQSSIYKYEGTENIYLFEVNFQWEIEDKLKTTYISIIDRMLKCIAIGCGHIRKMDTTMGPEGYFNRGLEHSKFLMYYKMLHLFGVIAGFKLTKTGRNLQRVLKFIGDTVDDGMYVINVEFVIKLIGSKQYVNYTKGSLDSHVSNIFDYYAKYERDHYFMRTEAVSELDIRDDDILSAISKKLISMQLV